MAEKAHQSTLSNTVASARAADTGAVSRRVVLVHGLWFRAAGLRLLAARLRRRDYDVRIFDYPSVHGDVQRHTHALQRFILHQPDQPVHLVGHSLGGLLIMRTLHEYPELPVAKVVLLGSPVQGSGVARRLARRWWSQWLVGASADLLGQGVRVPAGVPVGVIAGNRNMGVGRVLGGVSGLGDGTVSVSETRLAGAADHVVLPATHTGMVVSAAVAANIHQFLQHGQFQTAVESEAPARS